MKKILIIFVLSLYLAINASYTYAQTGESVVAPGASLLPVSGSYGFTEGPAVDAQGNIYFSDLAAGQIYKWSTDGAVTLFIDQLNAPNGLYFDKEGLLVACESGNGRLISIDSEGQVTVLADQYNQVQFNEPNDLWIDPKGGIYFTDPVYQSPVLQDGEHVYYLTPNQDQIIRVIDDMVRPNGIVGASDGETLYVTDHGAGQSFTYDINENGSLSNKQLFASIGSDGMTIDNEGNLYLTTDDAVRVFDAAGNHLEDIEISAEQPTNVQFGGTDNHTLFITARTAAYTIQMRVQGVSNSNANNGDAMTIEQTLSDEAQRNTIAFDGLAFLTGDLCSDSFLPPGKVADFSGFQYLRDNDPTGLGHNTDFVTITAFNMLNILTDSQIDELVVLAESQITMINEHGYARFPLMKAFRRLLEGDLPEGSAGLDKDAVMAYSAELYRLDGQISYDRAKTLGGILRSLTSEQQTKLAALKALNGVGNWDDSLPNPLAGRNLSQEENVAVMTYASEMYSWYAGSVEADTYFCPERQGTYFGSFYMKDMPAMGNPNFTIPDNLTADMGSDFLGKLTETQATLVTGLVDIQRDDLYEIVETRQAISTQLRRFMLEESVDEETVLSLAEKYGELDGEIVYNYATNFVGLNNSLSSEQAAQLMAIRNSWNTISCSGAFLYSESIDLPAIQNTDFLFRTSSGVTVYLPLVIK